MSTIKLKYKLGLDIILPVGSFTSVATRPQGLACAYLKQIKGLRAYRLVVYLKFKNYHTLPSDV